MAKLLDAMPLQQLQEIESRVALQLQQIRAALERRSQKGKSEATAKAPAVSNQEKKIPSVEHVSNREPVRAAATDDDMDGEGSIAGRWLDVPPGGSLDAGSVPKSNGVSDVIATAKVTASLPTSPSPSHAPRLAAASPGDDLD